MDKIKTFITSAIVFGISMSLLFILMSILIINKNNYFQFIKYGIIIGLFSGILFSSFITIFVIIVEKKIKIDLDSDENIIYQGLANHFKGMESVGGKLYFN